MATSCSGIPSGCDRARLRHVRRTKRTDSRVRDALSRGGAREMLPHDLSTVQVPMQGYLSKHWSGLVRGCLSRAQELYLPIKLVSRGGVFPCRCLRGRSDRRRECNHDAIQGKIDAILGRERVELQELEYQRKLEERRKATQDAIMKRHMARRFLRREQERVRLPSLLRLLSWSRRLLPQ